MVHLAVPVAARIVARPMQAYALLSRRIHPTDVSVDVTTEPVREQAPAGATKAYAFEAQRRQPRYPDAERTPHHPPPDSTSGPPSPEPSATDDTAGPTPPSTEAGPSDYDLPPSAPEPWAGSGWPGGTSPWAILPDMPTDHSSTAAPTKGDRRRPVDRDIAGRVVSEAMQGQDRTLSLDLPAASVVASVVKTAVRSVETPNESSATISATIGANGKVQAINLLGFAAGTAGQWRKVARAVEAMLAGRTFDLKKNFPKGAVVTVSVHSEMSMPAGSGGFQGTGFSFDLSNLGAHLVRKVTTGVSVQAIR